MDKYQKIIQDCFDAKTTYKDTDGEIVEADLIRPFEKLKLLEKIYYMPDSDAKYLKELRDKFFKESNEGKFNTKEEVYDRIIVMQDYVYNLLESGVINEYTYKTSLKYYDSVVATWDLSKIRLQNMKQTQLQFFQDGSIAKSITTETKQNVIQEYIDSLKKENRELKKKLSEGDGSEDDKTTDTSE